MQSSSITENVISSECPNESTNVVGGMSRHNSDNVNVSTSRIRLNPGASFYKNALKASLLLSTLVQRATPYLISPADITISKLIELSLKYRNIQCLIIKIFKFGEDNLILNGIDVRSELNSVGTNPEEITSKIFDINEIGILNGFDRINYTHESIIRHENYIAEANNSYNKIKEIALGAFEKISNISYFDTQAKYRLGNFSELVRTSDTTYHHCQDIDASNYYVNHNEVPDSPMAEKPIVIIIILMTILTLLYLFVRSTKKFRISRNIFSFHNNICDRVTAGTPNLINTVRNLVRGKNRKYRPLNSNDYY